MRAAGRGAGHPQRQRSPAAAEFEDRLAVLQAGVGGGFRERRLLGLGQGAHAGRIVAGRVLELRTQHGLEEGGGQFVVLGVGGLDVLGDRPGVHLAGEAGGALRRA